MKLLQYVLITIAMYLLAGLISVKFNLDPKSVYFILGWYACVVCYWDKMRK